MCARMRVCLLWVFLVCCDETYLCLLGNFLRSVLFSRWVRALWECRWPTLRLPKTPGSHNISISRMQITQITTTHKSQYLTHTSLQIYQLVRVDITYNIDMQHSTCNIRQTHIHNIFVVLPFDEGRMQRLSHWTRPRDTRPVYVVSRVFWSRTGFSFDCLCAPSAWWLRAHTPRKTVCSLFGCGNSL